MTDPRDAIPTDKDVAFSFLAADEPLARELAELLADRLSSFVFSERQKELAGTNGVATLTRIYEEFATLDVVLFRKGYGNTKWTRIEESAITSRGVNLGWDTVFLISLDGTKPVWLPASRLWYGIEQFGVRTGAEAILARFTDLKGEGRPESHAKRAARVGQRVVEKSEAEAWRHTLKAVNAVAAEVRWMRDYIRDELAVISADAAALGLRFIEPENEVFGAQGDGARLTFGWWNQYGNTIRNAYLFVRELEDPDMSAMPIKLRYSSGMQPVREVHYRAFLGEGDVVLWEAEEELETRYSSKELADFHIRRLIDRCGDVNTR